MATITKASQVITSAIQAAVTVIDGLLDVPTADATTNATVRDVAGNKADAANETADESSIIGLARAIIARLVTIDAFFDVPVADAADDVTIRDVVGRKTDTQAGTSLYSHAYGVNKHIHAPARVYPTLADGVTLTATADAWTALGALVEVVPANTITSPFDIHHIVIEALSANGVYEIALYTGPAETPVEIGRIRVVRSAVQNAALDIPTQGPIIAANTRISAAVSSSNAAEDTATISIKYHTY